ncbi:MAG: MgtC/SapB family protein, partial [Oscillospiraceae bacterium]|nr:MgtC/SapB family protein [Oscillospiraceae bacterium]
GLTTAAGLWASACMGLAIGAGFYECVLLAFLLITLCIRLLPALEAAIIERARDINIYVEFASLDDVGAIIARIKEQDVQVYSVDISRPQETGGRNPSAVFSLHLNRRSSHEDVLAAIFALDQVLIVDEI